MAVILADKLAKSDNFSSKWIAEEVSWILSDNDLQEKLY